MRELVYYVATTLDGFIARDDGSFDDFPWSDAFIDALTARYPETMPAPMRPGASRDENRCFDAVLMGRRTYEVGLRQGLTSPYPTLEQYVFSGTMAASPDPAITVVGEQSTEFVRSLKAESGLGIWICGGSLLATSLFEAGLVDRLILKLNPVVFGSGIPLFQRTLPAGLVRRVGCETFTSGHVLLEYEVVGQQGTGE